MTLTARGRQRDEHSHDAPGSVGMRRVALVRVLTGPGGVRAEAVGTGHRLPVTRAIPLGTATRLASQGVPLVLHHEDVEPT